MLACRVSFSCWCKNTLDISGQYWLGDVITNLSSLCHYVSWNCCLDGDFLATDIRFQEQERVCLRRFVLLPKFSFVVRFKLSFFLSFGLL